MEGSESQAAEDAARAIVAAFTRFVRDFEALTSRARVRFEQRDWRGMYADAVDETGVSAPAIAGTSKPEQVAVAVVRALKHDVAEVIVTPITGRPLAVIAAVVPGIGQTMMRLTGVEGAFKHMAGARLKN